MIHCKRAYDPPADTDGLRVLVDRLWPRNCRKDDLNLHDWLPQLAPSTQLRKAFKGGAMGFAEFSAAYRKELAANPAHWWALVEVAQHQRLTLIYAAKSTTENNAVVLAGWLEDELERRGQPSSSTCYLNEFPDR